MPEIPAALLGINLGIDFGTSFTKVCFRDVGSEASGVVTFGGRSAKNALIATVVCVDKEGMLFLENEVPEGKDCARVRYLKMRLAGIPIDGASAIAGFGVDEGVLTRALASWSPRFRHCAVPGLDHAACEGPAQKEVCCLVSECGRAS